VRRAKSKGELLSHLKRRGVTEDVANAVLYRLQEAGLVDDAAFAQAWVESRLRSKRLSKAVIAGELRAKGISQEQIAEAIGEIDSDTEYSSALELARRKMPSLGGCDPQTQRRRIHGALARRGFGFGVISQVMQEVGLQ
jgi:regulatory protein